MRDASSKSEESVGAYKVDRDMRLDLFQAKQSAAKAIELSGQKLGHEEARLVEHMLRDGQRAGLALSEAKRAQLTEMRKELQRSCTEFMVSGTLVTFFTSGYYVDIKCRKTTARNAV